MPKTKFTHSHSTFRFTGGMGVMTLREKTPYDTGFAAGTLLKKSGNEFVKLLSHRLLRFLIRTLAFSFRRPLKALNVPQDFLDELKGYADSTGIPYQTLYFLNFAYDIQEHLTLLCSSFAKFNTKNSLIMGHNTDLGSWVANVIMKHARTFVMNIAVPGKVPYALITHPCFIGGMNGFNAKGLGVLMDQIGRVKASKKGANTPGLLLGRMLLQEVDTLKKAEAMIKKNLTYFPITLLVSSLKDGKSQAFEIDSSQYGSRKNTFTFLFCTNHFESPKMRQHHRSIKQGSIDRFDALADLMKKNKTVTPAKAVEILKDHRNGIERDNTGHSLSNTGTFESFVFDVSKRVIWISNGRKPPVALTGKFIEIPVTFAD